MRCPRCAARFAVPATPTAAGAPFEPAPTVPDTDVPQPTVAEAGAVAPTVADDGALAPTRAEAPPAATPATASGIAWEPGEVVLGLYEVQGVLGQGGMGRVYRVRHRGWDLDLAVKAPLAAALDASGGADLFEREAETWVNLGLHPNVVTCHYVRRISSIPLVFAEYVDGGSLHDATRARRLDSAEAILDVAIQLAWGLHHAHEQGLVHRDVKPANVMLTSDGLAKVTDFGLARARSVRIQAPAGAGAGQSMTVEGGGGGTPAYLSPEQAAGRALDRRSDLWGFGLSVLEAFLGGRTWEYGLAAPEVLDAYRRDGLSAGGRPAMPERVADLLARCFQERPEDRPHDLVEVVDGLRAAWEQSAGRPYPRQEARGGRGSADALSNRAVSLVDLGRAAEAATLWRRALEAEAQHVEATYNSGLAAWVEGRLADPELLHRLEESCASHAGRARAHQLLGRVHLALGQGPEALAELERALSLGRSEELDRDVAAARVGAPPPLRTMRGLQGPVAAFALSPDGRTVAAGSGAEVRLWDAATGQLSRALSVPDGPVRSLALLPDGRFLVVGVENGPIALWDLSTGRQARSWTRHAGFATSLAVVPGGRLVASGGSDRIVRLWDATSGRVVHEMAGHEDAVTAVAVGPTRLASASRDGTVRVWALEDGRCLGTLRGHQGRVLAVALDEGQARLVSAGEDATVRDWGLHSLETVRVYRSHGQPVLAVALSPDGQRIVSGSADRTVRAFEAERLGSLARLDGAVHALAVAPDGTCWAAHGTMVSALPAHRLHVPPAALCRPASASEEEARASSVEARLEEARRSLAAGDLPTAVSLARRARSVPGHERSEATLAVWDDLCARLPRQALQSAWEDARLEGHEDQVLAVAVDRAGARALTAGLDATVRLWDLASRRPEVTLVGPLRGGHRRGLRGRGTCRFRRARPDRPAVGSRRPPGPRRPGGPRRDGHGSGRDSRRPARGERELGRHRAPLGPPAPRASCAFSRATGPTWQPFASPPTARSWPARDGTARRGCGTRTRDASWGSWPVTPATSRRSRFTATAVRWRRAARTAPSARGTLAPAAPSACCPDTRARSPGSPSRPTAGSFSRPAGTAPSACGTCAEARPSARCPTRPSCWGSRSPPWPALSSPPAPTAARESGTSTGSRRSRASPPAATPTARIGGDTVRTRVTAGAVAAPATTLREDLRRAAPIGIPVLPRAARAARRIPWGRAPIALALLAAVVVTWLAWRRPAAGLRVSPHMAQAVPKELDLDRPRALSTDCSPGDYERHLEQMRSGNPDARDVACLAARGALGRRGGRARRRATRLSRAPDRPAPAPQRRLGSRRAPGRRRPVAVRPPRRRPRRGPPRHGHGPRRHDRRRRHDLRPPGSWRAGLRRYRPPRPPPCASGPHGACSRRARRGPSPKALLASPDPAVRISGLLVAPLFTGDAVEPAVLPFLQDADPDVAATAREAVDAIHNVHRIDEAHGDTGS